MLGKGHLHAHKHGGPDDGVEADAQVVQMLSLLQLLLRKLNQVKKSLLSRVKRVPIMVSSWISQSLLKVKHMVWM